MSGPLVGTVSERIKITALKEGEEPVVRFNITSANGDGPEGEVGPGLLQLTEFVHRFGEEIGKEEPGAEEVKLTGPALAYLRQAGKIGVTDSKIGLAELQEFTAGLTAGRQSIGPQTRSSCRPKSKRSWMQ